MPIQSSIWNFLVNILGGLIAYTYNPIKPSLHLEAKSLPALTYAFFKLHRTHILPLSAFTDIQQALGKKINCFNQQSQILLTALGQNYR